MAESKNCPNCGGEVPIPVAAARTARCGYCDSALIVNEAAIRALGKMALLTDTPSCLAVGWHVKCLKRNAKVLGRVQYKNDNSIWDEWWIEFEDDGSTAWISQNEGTYVFEKPVKGSTEKLPKYDDVKPGDTVPIGKRQLQVNEKDIGKMVGLQGEVPFEASPDEVMRYLELADDRIKCTIEYFADGDIELFQGRYLKSRDLIAIPQDGTEGPPPLYGAPMLTQPGATKGDVAMASDTVEIKPFSCPSCGGSVTLNDPNKSVMMMCNYCGSAIDVTVEGTPQLLYKSDQKKLFCAINVGDKGKLHGIEYTVIGRVRYKEDMYFWDVLQLFNPVSGYAFLECSEGHWMFSRTLRSPIKFDPRYASPGQRVQYKGQTFKVFEKSTSHINYVEGELTWVARKNDVVHYMDAVAPPQMLSAEWTDKEMEWSLGSYVEKAELANAFKVDIKRFPKSSGVGAAQPFKISKDQKFRSTFGLVATLTMLVVGFMSYFLGESRKEVILTDTITHTFKSEQGWISKPFTVPEGSHICELKIYNGRLSNSWVAFSVAILDENETVVLDADTEAEYYSGRDSDGAWTEGSRDDGTLLRLDGPHEYRLNVFGEASGNGVGNDTQITVTRGVIPKRYFLVGFVLMGLYPAWQITRKGAFEKARWPSDDDDD